MQDLNIAKVTSPHVSIFFLSDVGFLVVFSRLSTEVALDTESFGSSAFLVFLPGRNELHQLRLCLERQRLWVNVLHANMAMEVQSSILKPGTTMNNDTTSIRTHGELKHVDKMYIAWANI